MLEDVKYEDLAQYPHYIIKCDIYIPKELHFIPIPVKMTTAEYAKIMGIKGGDKIKGSFYATGNFIN